MSPRSKSSSSTLLVPRMSRLCGVAWRRSTSACPDRFRYRRRCDAMHDRPAAGEVVTETFGYDGGRPVTVYVPADPPEAVVFTGDGQLIPQWGGALEAAGVPS